MKCEICTVNKLSNEFFLDTGCNHPPKGCARCLWESFNETEENKSICIHRCSVSETEREGKKAELRRFLKALEPQRFKEVNNQGRAGGSNEEGEWRLTAVMMDGQTFPFTCSNSSTVEQCRMKVAQMFQEKPSKIRLNFQGTNLIDFNARLSEFGVKNGSSIQILILMVEEFVGTKFENLKFKLTWGYPDIGTDYLDATCLTYANKSFLGLVNWEKLRLSGIQHHGDQMNEAQLTGSHSISISVNQLDPRVTHLYFVLSAYRLPHISRYPNPTVELYDQSQPDRELSAFRKSDAGEVQSLIMCRIVKQPEDKWSIERMGVRSAGNSAKYAPIHETIEQRIAW